jgi:formate dehydrogenase major subunit
MNPEGTARLFSRGMMSEGPFPAHYEPFESPVVNVLAPKIRGNPAARIFKDDLAALGNSDKFPYAATSYRLTEHFHFWTKHVWVNACCSRNSSSRSASSWRRRRTSRPAAG